MEEVESNEEYQNRLGDKGMIDTFSLLTGIHKHLIMKVELKLQVASVSRLIRQQE